MEELRDEFVNEESLEEVIGGYQGHKKNKLEAKTPVKDKPLGVIIPIGSGPEDHIFVDDENEFII